MKRLVSYTSLRLQIPCTYSLPTSYIYSTFNRKPVWNPVEHLRWRFFSEIVNKVVGYFLRKAPLCIFDKMFDRILNATLSNNLSQLEESQRISFPPRELQKGILDSLCLPISLVYTNNKGKSSAT